MASKRLATKLTESWGPGRDMKRTASANWRVRMCADTGVLVMPSVGPGWQGILESLWRNLRAQGHVDRLPVMSVGEHGGGLDITVIKDCPWGAALAVARARQQSFRTCVLCANTGTLHHRGARDETTCTSCDEKLRKEDANGRQPASHY